MATSGLDATVAKNIVDVFTGVSGATFAAPTTPILVMLTTNTAGTLDDNTRGTALAGVTPQALGASQAASTAGAAGASTSNTGAVSFTGMPAASNINNLELRDSSTSPGKRSFWGDITGAPKTTQAGDTLSISAAALTITLG